jgi:hypothetical protein
MCVLTHGYLRLLTWCLRQFPTKIRSEYVFQSRLNGKLPPAVQLGSFRENTLEKQKSPK